MRRQTSGEALDRWLLAAEQTAGGKIRKRQYIRCSEWLLIICTAISVITASGFSIYMSTLAEFSIVFTIIDCKNAVFTIFYAVYGVLGERPYEMATLVTSYVLSGLFMAVNLDSRRLFPTVSWACGVIAVFLLPVVILTFIQWRNYRQSKNLIVRTVVDRADLLDAVDVFYRYQALLVLDFQLSLSILLLVCYYPGPKTLMFSPALIGMGIPLSLVCLLLGLAVMYFERLWLMIIFCLSSSFMLLCIAADIYDAYVLVDFGMGRPPIIPIVTTVHSVVTLVVRIALYISLVAVYKHYGLGVGSTLLRPNPKTLYREEAHVHFAKETSDQTQYQTVPLPSSSKH